MSASRQPVSAVILLQEDGAALFQHRDDKPGLRHAGLWAFPGGHGEPGEDLAACARREFREETCVQLLTLNWLACAPEAAGDGDTYPLNLYWSRYDGKQEIKCFEGQEVRFIPRGESDRYPIVRFLLPYWDLALEKMRSTGC